MLDRPFARILFALTLAAYAISMVLLPAAAMNDPEICGIMFDDVAPFFQLTFAANALAAIGSYLFRARFFAFREGSWPSVALALLYVGNFLAVGLAMFLPVILGTMSFVEPVNGQVSVSPTMGHLIGVANAAIFVGVCLAVLAGQTFGSEVADDPFG